jgi:purine-binding chemotaxis protein CheW
MHRASAATREAESDVVAGSDPDRNHQLILRVGAYLCAVPLAQVVETMRLLPIKPVAGVPAYVRGLSIIRGQPVPVVDAALLIGNESMQAARLVTIRTGARIVALAVGAVLGVIEIGAAGLSELPPLMREAATETIAGVGMLDRELLLLLRTARIFPQSLFDRLAAAETTP